MKKTDKKQIQRQKQIDANKNVKIMRGREKYAALLKRAGIDFVV